ncbi:hypothetical protein EVAR_17651_1 [Eumeta japonica]|uniref:Uncharacterized protein n=1 Tax=Eumeta variegata TaxID=151549 RepID=A0A4C1URN5_EUMVA|nr:hypothetical protein EVAR_17651_1 [Eumeta japonica]
MPIGSLLFCCAQKPSSPSPSADDNRRDSGQTRHRTAALYVCIAKRIIPSNLCRERTIRRRTVGIYQSPTVLYEGLTTKFSASHEYRIPVSKEVKSQRLRGIRRGSPRPPAAAAGHRVTLWAAVSERQIQCNRHRVPEVTTTHESCPDLEYLVSKQAAISPFARRVPDAAAAR